MELRAARSGRHAHERGRRPCLHRQSRRRADDDAAPQATDKRADGVDEHVGGRASTGSGRSVRRRRRRRSAGPRRAARRSGRRSRPARCCAARRARPTGRARRAGRANRQRQRARSAVGERVAARAGGLALAFQDRLRAGEQLDRHQLLDHRAARCPARRGRRRGVDQGRVRADPADPQAGPERLAHRADRDHGLARRVERGDGRLGRAVEVQADDRLVDDQRRPRRAGQRDEPLAVRGAHREAGRVLVVGDQVRERGRGLAERRGEHLDVPAVVEHRHGHGPRAARTHGVERGGVGRVLDDDAIARAGQHAQEQRQRVQRARGRRGSGRPSSARPAATDTRRSPRAAPAARRRRSPGRAGAAGARRWPRPARRAGRRRARRWPRS